MHIYQLTPRGKAIAQSTTGANTINWRVIYALDRLNYATPEQISLQTEIGVNDIATSLIILRRKGIVGEG